MIQVEKILQEICPDGVEYKKIKDAFVRLKGTPITAGKMKEIDNPDGEIKVFAGGKTVINATEKDIPNANITRVPAVLVQSRGVIDFIYYDKPFTFKNEMWAYTADNEITVKFLYYLLKNDVEYFRDSASGMGALPQISLGITEDYEVPLPPLAAQREIVHVLDKFTLLSSELAAELAARKEQYEYYRDSLLTFSDDVPMVKLGELCSLVTKQTGFDYSNHIKDSLIMEEKEGTVPYIQTKFFTGKTFNYNTDYYVPQEIVNRFPKITLDSKCLLFSIVGASIGNVGLFPNERTCFLGGAICVAKVKPEYNIEYLYYCIEAKDVQRQIRKKTKGAGQATITVEDIREFSIPLPPIEVQNEIVRLLNSFSSLCNDITTGLPAEIEARQKQYEYYRDKLLTFKKLS